MRPIAAGVLVLLLAWPALPNEDKPKAPPTPAEQYQALVKEYNDAQQAVFKEYQEAKTQEEKQKVLREKQPSADKFAAKFLTLAEKYPKDPAAVDALVWVVSNVFAPRTAKNGPRAKALALLRDHAANPKVGGLCQRLARSWNDREAEALLRAILARNPSKEVQSDACLALAQLVGQKAAMAQQLKDQEMAARFVQFFGKETVEELKKLDLRKLDAENQQLYREFADKYLPGLSAERVSMLLQRLSNSSDKGGELVLRRLLEQDKGKPEIQGQACLALAKSLKARAETLADTDAKQAAKLQAESEQLFERAEKKYGDVKAGFRGTIAEQAKNELYELRFLSKGKAAPEVDAEDLDGKKFKLSDYKGKVVLLDFWGNW